MITTEQKSEIREKIQELCSHLSIEFGCIFPTQEYDKNRMERIVVTIYTPGEDLNFFSYKDTIAFLGGAIFIAEGNDFFELSKKA